MMRCPCALWIACCVECVRYEDWRGRSLSPPTEIDALYGLLFASFYYLYLQARNLMDGSHLGSDPLARGVTLSHCPLYFVRVVDLATLGVCVVCEWGGGGRERESPAEYLCRLSVVCGRLCR